MGCLRGSSTKDEASGGAVPRYGAKTLHCEHGLDKGNSGHMRKAITAKMIIAIRSFKGRGEANALQVWLHLTGS